MKASSLQLAIVNAIESRAPLMIWGPPGVGKSDSVRQAAAKLGLPVIDVRLGQLESVDLRGLPSIIDGRTVWQAPDFLPRDGKGVLFLDEFVQGSKSIQVAASQLILDRQIGNYRLPDGWAVIAAGNRLEDRAGTTEMPSHQKSRFRHATLDVDLEDWVSWALDAGVSMEIVQFLRWRPDLLWHFDPRSKSPSYPCPRTWEFASRFLASEPPREIEREQLCGIVGEGAAHELAAFLQIFRNLPDPDLTLKAPDTAEVPSDPSVLYALIAALVSRARDWGPQDADKARAFLKYASRIRPEYSVMMVNDGRRAYPGLLELKEWAEWASKHADVLF